MIIGNGIMIGRIFNTVSSVVPETPVTPPSDLVFSDNFNRADNTSLGSSWSNIIGSMGVQNQKAYVVTTVSRTTMVATDVGMSDCIISADITVANQDGLSFRVVDSSNYYFARLTANGLLQVYRVLSGASTLLGEYSVGSVSGGTYRMKIKVQGDILTIGVDSNESMVSTNTSYFNAATMFGLRSYSTGAYGTYDNFECRQVI